ncbi:MAG: serine/threonine protein kinase [Myxococcales bacterium]|nr:MAG: serine/threonine protein kinase [Myxococcales bacterium]
MAGDSDQNSRPTFDAGSVDTWPDDAHKTSHGAAQDTWPDTRESRLSSRMLKDKQDSVTTLPPAPLVGKVLDGRYEIQRMIGEGGMGIVYQARHTTLGKILAVKVLRGENLDALSTRRFKQEAQSASAIGHENIVNVMDFGNLPDGATYFVMEYLDGVTLKAAMNLSREPFSVQRAIHIAKQLCVALQQAHRNDVVHRDLKPDNIYLVTRAEDEDFVKILDFRMPKLVEAQARLLVQGRCLEHLITCRPSNAQALRLTHAPTFTPLV